MLFRYKKHTLIRISIMLMLSYFISACGSDSTSINTQQASISVPEKEPKEDPKEEVTPTLVTHSVIGLEFELIGEKVVNLVIGENYTDAGAMAISDTEGDISSSILLLGSINTNIKGDYLLRYQVKHNADGIAEIMRVVRVFDDAPVRQSQRIKNSTSANFGYLEHLPLNYAQSDNIKAPLIIFNHGSGASGTGNLNHVECCGLAGVLDAGDWDDTLPFVVLSPQRKLGIDTPALNVFVEYAIATYDIDPQRVYMAGWSQGANATMLYSIAYPEKLAAIVPTAGGLFRGIPGNVCNASSVPMWLFLGDLDNSTITRTGLNSANAYSNCNPKEPVKITRLLDADHYHTSIWPFLPAEYYATDIAHDDIEQSIFDWLLSHNL